MQVRRLLSRGWVRGNRASICLVSSHSMMVPSSPLQVVYEDFEGDNYEEISKVHPAAGVMVKGVGRLAQPSFWTKGDRGYCWGQFRYPVILCRRNRHTMEYLKSHTFVLETALSLLYLEFTASLLMRFISSSKSVITYVHAPIITGSDAEVLARCSELRHWT